jgi:hypothetical protein
MFVVITLLVTFVCLLVSYFWILKSRYDYFICRNIPGPAPQFFFGHYLTLWKLTSYPNKIQDWTRQYGSIYGLHQWRRQRHVINPTFTTLKLKTMAPLMNRCIESMLVKVTEMNDSQFNIYTLYKRLTMDVICE